MVLSERIERLDMVVKGLDAILLAIHDEPDVVFCRKELTTFKYHFQQRVDSLRKTVMVVQKYHKTECQQCEHEYSGPCHTNEGKCSFQAKNMEMNIPNGQ